ncbi:MAG TPA: hypothetical protein VD908_00825 [Cytophagales bacterium]|nr:hypothetical protein [Cytophagales bacterium]
MSIEKKVQEIHELVERLTRYINEEIVVKNNKSGQELAEPLQFFLNLLFKTNNALDTANFLFGSIIKKPRYNDSIGLILRTSLSDVISYMYILHKSGGNEKQLIHWINICDYDHIQYFWSKEKVYKKVSKVSTEEWDQMKDTLKENFPQFFDENGLPNDSIYKRWKTPGPIALEIFESGKEKQYQYLREAFEYYDLYSKVEHLGKATEFLIHESFHDEFKINSLIRIHRSFIILSFHLSVWATYFSGKGTEEINYIIERVNDLCKIKLEN